MSDTRKEVFIQNLKDTTTVLQQLRVCIEAVKSLCDDIDIIDKDTLHLYRHNITLQYNEDGEEPDTTYLITSVLTTSKEEFTLDTLREYLKINIKDRDTINATNSIYDEVNHVDSSYLGNFRLTNVYVYANINDTISVSIQYYDSSNVETSANFIPNDISDKVSKIF